MLKTKRHRRRYKRGGENTSSDSSTGLRNRKTTKATFNPDASPFPSDITTPEKNTIKATYTDTIEFPDTGKPDIFQQAKEAREEDESWVNALKGDNMEPWSYKAGRRRRSHRHRRSHRRKRTRKY